MSRKSPDVLRTRAFWDANKPAETGAPGYVPDPPAWWHVAVALVVALGLQSTLAPFVAVRGAVVSLVLLVVVWYAVRTGSLRGFTFGLIAGACEDALAGSTGVAWTFSTALTGALAGRLARTWLADTKVALVPGAAIVTLVRYGAFATIMQLQGRPAALPLAQLHVALWQSLFDAALALAALWLFPQLGGTGAHRR
jgi:rod shape-determining protein MreD